jgi:hypothetical protein
MEEQLQFIIAELKSKFGEIHAVEVEETGELYLFRLLTRKEYAEIMMIAGNDKNMKEELICQVAVVWPEGLNFAQGDAGLPSLIAPEIVNESGFGTLQKSHYYFNFYRSQMSLFDKQAEAAIQAAFPDITDEEMMDWTVDKLMQKLAKAEWILKNVKGYPVSFEEQSVEETTEEVEPPTFKELGNQMREQGLDPMIEYAPYILRERPFAEFPFIAGTDYWRRHY